MDIDVFLIAFGLIATGAIFFGYPLGLRHGSKRVADAVCEKLNHDAAVLSGRRADERANILEAEVIE